MDDLPLDYVPELRARAPWLMDEMVSGEPGLVSPILANDAARSMAAQVLRVAQAGGPITIVGCGTSETAAMAIAELLTDALRRKGDLAPSVRARQALEAANDPVPGGYCLAISHEGGTRATVLAMDAARNAGARVGLITARSKSIAIEHADDVVVTPLIDRSWCHTVGYLSPILVGASLGESIEPGSVEAATLEPFLKTVLGLRGSAKAVAIVLGNVDRLVVVASGPDRSPAKELALKIEEGAHLPTRVLELETLLHGHLAAYGAGSGLILITTGGPPRALQRASMAIRAARQIGMNVAAIMSSKAASAVGAESIDAGLVILPASVDQLGLIGRLCGAALCLQLLTLELASARGTNPDLIGRDREAYRKAAAIAESDSTW